MKNNRSPYHDVAVIIPAYCESDNLKILLPRILKTLPGAYVVVVNDSKEPKSKQTESTVILQRGTKKGRGSAVLDGMKCALRKSYIQYFIEMDADLAHAPQECKALIEASARADMVIGSRYLKGSVISDWPMYRLVQSRIINVFLRLLLGLPLSDFTNGFRLYKRPVVEFLTKTAMKEKGFIALSEIVYKAHKYGFRILEVPVSFKDREFGASQANIRELLMSLVGAFRIRIG